MNRMLAKLFAMALALLLSGCGPKFPAVQSAYISPVDIHIASTRHWEDIALSPDGNSIVIAEDGLKQIDLATGTESYPFNSYTDLPKDLNLLRYIGTWSSDGRYLGIAGNEYNSETNTVRYRNRIIDTKTRTIRTVPGRVFWQWSPFDTGTYLTRQEDAKDILGVYNMYNPETFISLDGSVQYDFTQETEVAGNGEYLWSKRVDLPIAELTPLWSGKAENMTWRNLAIISFFDYKRPDEWKYQQILIDGPASHIVGAIFDPTGEYALVAEWECAYTDTSHCSDVDVPPVLDGITDSVFTLIHWRSGEKRELFRLTSIDPQNVIASGDLYWSADGSTIVLGRIHASLVVLKVK